MTTGTDCTGHRQTLLHVPEINLKARTLDMLGQNRSRNQFGDRCFATAGPTLSTVCLNSCGNRTSPSDNSNDR